MADSEKELPGELRDGRLGLLSDLCSAIAVAWTRRNVGDFEITAAKIESILEESRQTLKDELYEKASGL